MPAALLTGYELSLLLVLAALIAQFPPIVIKRLLVFVFLLSLPVYALWMVPVWMIGYATLVGLADGLPVNKSFRKTTTESTDPGAKSDKETQATEESSLAEGRWLRILFFGAALVFFGAWLFGMLPVSVEAFRLLPLDSDFLPRSTTELLQELWHHKAAALHLVLILVLLAALSLCRLLVWRKTR